MNQVTHDELFKWLKINVRHMNDDFVPFKKIEGENYRFINLNTKYNGLGITEFRGIIVWKQNGFCHQSKEIIIPPLFILHYVSRMRVVDFYEPINSLVFEIQFKTPLNDEVIKHFPEAIE